MTSIQYILLHIFEFSNNVTWALDLVCHCATFRMVANKVGGWNNACRWTLKRDRPLSEHVLRSATLELIKRHPALRSRPAEPMDDFKRTQEALSVFEMCRKHLYRQHSWTTALEKIAHLAFLHAWPQIAACDYDGLRDRYMSIVHIFELCSVHGLWIWCAFCEEADKLNQNHSDSFLAHRY